jgi:integrase
MAAPLKRTSTPGVYRRGSRWVAVYLEDGRQRRRGRAYEFDERRFLTRKQLARLLAEIPDEWRPLFELLASTGLRISEAIALRVMDADLDAEVARIHVRRAIVSGQLTGPKSATADARSRSATTSPRSSAWSSQTVTSRSCFRRSSGRRAAAWERALRRDDPSR